MERRILFFHEAFPAGGAERVTADIANYLAGFHYQIIVCCRVHNDGCAATANVKLIELPDKSYTQSEVNIDFLVNTIRTLRVDIFVLPVQALVELCQSIKSRTNCKLVFALHSIPFWEVTYRLYEKKKNSRDSFGKWLEWHLLTYPKTVWLKKYNRAFIEIYRRVYQLSDAYIVLCDDYKRMLVEALQLPSKEEKIAVIHNSEKVVETVSMDKKKQVLFVGRFTYEDKRVDRLLEIWRSVYRKADDWELVLVGDGPERDRLEQYIRKYRIERVRLAGYSDCVSSYYREAAVLCLTSTFEGWGLCLTEAQANGVVPIAFDCTAGVCEVLSPSGVNGILIPSYNKKMYARKLLHLLQHPEEHRQMQQNVIIKARNYSPDRVGERWRLLFEHLCNE